MRQQLELILCPHCEREFDLNEIFVVKDRGPNSADIQCPICYRMISNCNRPTDVERPPEIRCKSFFDRKARIYFETRDWLQYRQRDDSLVIEEMYSSDDVLVESFEAEVGYGEQNPEDVFSAPEEYVDRFEQHYDKLTIQGLKVRFPHVYAVVIDRQAK